MNKKTKTYILIFAVILIWSTIAYKFFSAINPEKPDLIVNTAFTSFKPQVREIDTFEIQELSRDPFLGTLKEKVTHTTGKRSKKTDTVAVPQLQYLGLLKTQKSKHEIFVLNIDEVQYLVKKGQTINDLKVVRANSKNMIVRFKNKTLTLPIQ